MEQKYQNKLTVSPFSLSWNKLLSKLLTFLRNIRILIISRVSNQKKQAKTRLGIYNIIYVLAITMQWQFQARENIYQVAHQIWNYTNCNRRKTIGRQLTIRKKNF